MALALLRGFVLGVACCIPVGPVNAAVIDTAMRKCLRRAIAVGMGGAFVDFLYSQAAIFGLGELLDRAPGLSTAMIGIGGVVLVVLGISAIKAPPPPPEATASPPPVKGDLASSFLSGALITFANPAALISWVLIAGAVLSDLSGTRAISAGIGIFAGCVAWFAGIAYLASLGRIRLGARAVWITRTVGVLLVAYGVFLVGKASVVVWAHR